MAVGWGRRPVIRDRAGDARRAARRFAAGCADRAQGEELARRFFAAAAGGDISTLLDLLAPDVVTIGDGGGKAQALREPLRGQAQVARFIVGLFRRGHYLNASFRPAWVNGQPGGVSYDAAGRVINFFALDIADGKIRAVRSVLNPDKLAHLGPVSDVALRPEAD